MMGLTEGLKERLFESGAALVGVGDLKSVGECGYDTGVSVAVPLPKHVIRDLQKAPTKEYYELYDILNNKLNGIITAGERFLQENYPSFYSAARKKGFLLRQL